MNWRSELWSSAIRVTCFCALAAVNFGADAGQTSSCLQRKHSSQESLNRLVSRQQLTPPLRSTNASLRYSHDGRYLALQDQAGIYLLSRAPLKLLGYLDAPGSYPVRFSADSETIIMISRNLTYERWRIRDGQRLDSRALAITDGCVDAQLSPDGALLACYRPDFQLGILDLSSGGWIFLDKVHDTDPHVTILPIPLDLDVPFAGPFGFTLSRDMNLLANRGINRLPMAFSPDGRTLLAGELTGAVRIDTVERKKAKLPSAIQKLMDGTVAIQNESTALVIPRGRSAEAAVRSLRDGSVLATPHLRADSASLATDSRYALLHDSGAPATRVFDLQQDRPVETPENTAVDVFAGELAVATKNGELLLFRRGEHAPFASVLLPAESLSPLHRAAVTPGLERVAIAGQGEAGLFEIASGRLISNLEEFSAVHFKDSSRAFLLTPEPGPEPSLPLEYVIDRVDAQGSVHASPTDREATLARGPQTIWQLDATDGKVSPAWEGGETLLRAAGAVLFEYSFENLAGKGLFLPRVDTVSSGRGARLPQGIGVPFRLRTLDLASGKELWSRTFSGLPPVPFADPQGERLVLSWEAKSAGAWAAAKHTTAAKEALNNAKLTDQDSFLEVLEARTGKSLGGVLVQTGSGPANFDLVFSVGESIIFSRDAVRVYVYSILDGKLKAKLVGARPSANAESNLLALDMGLGQLAIYDLNTTIKLDEEIVPDTIIYTHFSADGQRLFVLTENQYAFVLDMRSVRQARSLAPDCQEAQQLSETARAADKGFHKSW